MANILFAHLSGLDVSVTGKKDDSIKVDSRYELNVQQSKLDPVHLLDTFMINNLNKLDSFVITVCNNSWLIFFNSHDVSLVEDCVMFTVADWLILIVRIQK